jgi:CheY-like chemotaxis protein
VRADSAGEDRGATFTVCLPLSVVRRSLFNEPRSHPRTPPPVPPSIFADLSGIKVLVVDDDSDARTLIERVLEDCGADVTTADGAAEGLRLFQQNKPDLVVCDIGMPHVDGYELLRRIRSLADGDGTKTPAIALTAFARSEDRTRALRAGFRVHVSKPVEPSELIATVASVVGRAGADSY